MSADILWMTASFVFINSGNKEKNGVYFGTKGSVYSMSSRWEKREWSVLTHLRDRKEKSLQVGWWEKNSMKANC